LDFTAVATEVGPAEVVGDDDKDVGWLLCGERGGEESESEEDGEKAHGRKRKTPGWFE
jgi:hypothetical protein